MDIISKNRKAKEAVDEIKTIIRKYSEIYENECGNSMEKKMQKIIQYATMDEDPLGLPSNYKEIYSNTYAAEQAAKYLAKLVFEEKIPTMNVEIVGIEFKDYYDGNICMGERWEEFIVEDIFRPRRWKVYRKYADRLTGSHGIEIEEL